DRRAFALRIFHILSQVPTISVDYFPGVAHAELGCLFTDSGDGGTVGIVLGVCRIVVAKLNDYKVAGLNSIEDFCPGTLFNVTTTAATATPFVVNVNLCRIEQRTNF